MTTVDSMPRSGSVTDEADSNICGVCNVVVVENEKAMQCDLCNRWNHNTCSSMPDDLYKALRKHDNKNTGVKWFCKTCEMHFGKLRLEMKAVAERQGIVELKQVTMEAGLVEVRREVVELKKEFKEFVKATQQSAESDSIKVVDKIEEIKGEITGMKKSYSEILSSGIGAEASLGSLNVPVRNIKVEVSEVMEREKRKNNLVIFGIEETHDEMATREKVNAIINVVGLEESKIKYFGRVGRIVVGAKPRLVRVVCEDADTKRRFLKAANKLKTTENYANIYIAVDLTRVQQAQDKVLRDKLREFKDVHKEAKINNSEIVVFEEGNRKVLFSYQQ